MWTCRELTPEQRRSVRPWMIATAVSFVGRQSALIAMVVCILVDVVHPAIALAVVFGGISVGRRFERYCMRRADRVVWETAYQGPQETADDDAAHAGGPGPSCPLGSAGKTVDLHQRSV